MTSIHRTINVYKNNNIVNKITTLYYINIEIILHYITHILLYFKGHTKLTIIHTTINIYKNNNIVNKITTLYYINLEIILHHINLPPIIF